MAATSKCHMEIEFSIEEGEPLGATLNDKLIITKIQNGTIADGKLKIGDQIIKVNGQLVSDQNSFYKALRFSQPKARLIILRDSKKNKEPEARFQIPQSRAKMIRKREGFTYFLAKLVWKPDGPKLGLGIKRIKNHVLVSRCDAGSLSASQLAVGDSILDIDGVPVYNKDVARDLIVNTLQEKAEVTLLIERPESTAAKQWAAQVLEAPVCQPTNADVNWNVRLINSHKYSKINQSSSAQNAGPGKVRKP